MENCKNCKTELVQKSGFCHNCGAKSVNSRITLKSIFSEFKEKVLGIDNKFFLTIKDILINPKEMIGGYLEGRRKKYVAPLTFFALGMTISILCFNILHDDYIELSGNAEAVDLMINQPMPADYMADSDLTLEAKQVQYYREISQAILMLQLQEATLKYFNLFSFALLPLYTFVGFLVYRKKYNYGEHLVINSYLQGFLFLLTSLSFLLAVFVHKDIYGFSLILSTLFYLYVYSKLFGHSVGKAALYFLKFILISLLLFAVVFLVGIGIGILLS